MHPNQDYFRKYFCMQGWFDMQPTWKSMLAKFYSCKKWVLHPTMKSATAWPFMNFNGSKAELYSIKA
jgi:hypothetical protein